MYGEDIGHEWANNMVDAGSVYLEHISHAEFPNRKSMGPSLIREKFSTWHIGGKYTVSETMHSVIWW